MSHEAGLSILLVEDDDVAAESVMRSLSRSGCNFPLVWAEDGGVALNILRGADAHRKLSRPRLILLDLNMPHVDGFEFLRQLRADPALRDEVVFVLTTSDAELDRNRAYQECIAGYMVKSAVGPQFRKLAMLLTSFDDAVRLP